MSAITRLKETAASNGRAILLKEVSTAETQLDRVRGLLKLFDMFESVRGWDRTKASLDRWVFVTLCTPTEAKNIQNDCERVFKTSFKENPHGSTKSAQAIYAAKAVFSVLKGQIIFGIGLSYKVGKAELEITLEDFDYKST